MPRLTVDQKEKIINSRVKETVAGANLFIAIVSGKRTAMITKLTRSQAERDCLNRFGDRFEGLQ